MYAILFNQYEAVVPFHAGSGDPFDPSEIAVQGVVERPDGLVETRPAFWDGERWLWRYRPTIAGAHRVVFSANELKLQELDLEVSDRGPLSPIHTDGFGFRDAEGAPWTPVGLNVGWAPADQQELFERWFQSMEEQGGDFARVWLAGFARQAPEWETLGAYDPIACAIIDRMLEQATEHGVRVLLVLWQHSQLQAFMWSSWKENPYNAANGGPCADSACFFEDPVALDYQSRLLRYAVARWGAYPALAGWEVMNELDGVQGVDTPTTIAWAQDRADEIRALDSLHPVTWSFSLSVWTGADDWNGADFSQLHSYMLADVEPVVQGLERLLDEPLPATVGEWGLDFLGTLDAKDVEGRAWHNANWAALASGSAGNAWSWWWDSHIDPHALFYRLAGPAALARELDLPAMAPFTPACTGARCLGRQSQEQALLWLMDSSTSWEENSATSIDDAAFYLPDSPGGQVRFMDTVTGEILDAEHFEAGQPVAVPPFERDIAALIELRQEPATSGCTCSAARSTRATRASWVLLLALLARLRRRQPKEIDG